MKYLTTIFLFISHAHTTPVTKDITSSLKKVVNPRNFVPKPTNVAALCLKELILTIRNLKVLLFTIINPIFTFLLFSSAVGKQIKGLKVVYANDDYLPDSSSLSFLCNNSDMNVHLDMYENLGQLFTDELTYSTSLSPVS